MEGSVQKVSEEESEQYFHSRPQGSQLGAIASPQVRINAFFILWIMEMLILLDLRCFFLIQSSVVPGRHFLINKYKELEDTFSNGYAHFYLERPTNKKTLWIKITVSNISTCIQTHWLKLISCSSICRSLIPKPKHWGGYRLKPELFEFWQGQPSRLHDRLFSSL